MLDKGMLCYFRNIHPSVQKLRPEKDPGGENEASQWRGNPDPAYLPYDPRLWS